jgi:uncharacterized protein with HEPN domain
MSRTPKDRLTDIAEAAAAVRKATEAIERAEADSSEDEAQLAFDALLYRLLIIGEAVKALPTDVTLLQPDVPWKEIARLRDLLAHHYYRVDAQVIRRTVEAPLDQLVAAVEQLIAADGRSRQAAEDAAPEDGRIH